MVRHRERIRRIDAHLERGDEVLLEIREAVRELKAEVGLNRAVYARESQASRDVQRALVAEIYAQREESRRHNEAMIGALADLAAEIRSWGGGGASPATG
jgi:hypothetical protein